MIVEAFQKLEEQIQNNTTGIKLLDWFNDQYQGIIHTSPAVFIEFPEPLPARTNRFQFQVLDFTVRIHLVNALKTDNSKKFDINVLKNHEAQTEQIYYALQGFRADYEPQKILFDSLMRTVFEHHHYLKGWLVTTQDFKSRIYQHQAPQTTVTPTGISITAAVEKN